MSGLQVHKNIVWKIKGLTPTSALARERFRYDDNPEYTGEDPSVADRLFRVYFESTDEVAPFSDLGHRWNDVTYTIEVGYDGSRRIDELHNLMLQDRTDLIKLLRDPASFFGYSDANSTDDIGLKNRIFDGDELERDAPTYIYRMRWVHKIMELE